MLSVRSPYSTSLALQKRFVERKGLYHKFDKAKIYMFVSPQSEEPSEGSFNHKAQIALMDIPLYG